MESNSGVLRVGESSWFPPSLMPPPVIAPIGIELVCSRYVTSLENRSEERCLRACFEFGLSEERKVARCLGEFASNDLDLIVVGNLLT